MSLTGKAESYVEMRGSLKIPDMITGKSAYEIAVMHGFQGTEEEWIKHVTAEADRSEAEANRAQTEADRAKSEADRAMEKDPTVPDWAKQPTKPSYTPAEVGAAPAVESSEHPGCYFRTANGVTEWVNPPAMLGIEYRTTERWQGKPVYVVAMDLGTLPTSGDKDVYYPVSIEPENMLSYNATIFSPNYGARSLPTFSSDGSVMAYAWSLNATIRITVLRDMSVYNGRAIVKYIKE